MTRTFLVAINFDDSTLDLVGEAADLREDLEHAGHDVLSVHPWAAPTLGQMGQPATQIPLTQPNPNTPV